MGAKQYLLKVIDTVTAELKGRRWKQCKLARKKKMCSFYNDNYSTMPNPTSDKHRNSRVDFIFSLLQQISDFKVSSMNDYVPHQCHI